MRSNIAYILVPLVITLVLQDCDAWRRRRIRIRLRKALTYYRYYKIGTAVAAGKRAVADPPEVFIAKSKLDAYQNFVKMVEKDENAACQDAEVCGGSCFKGTCKWNCDDICNIIVDDNLVWPGTLVELPCKFEDYDKNNDNFISSEELAAMVGEKSDGENNLLVFSQFDQDGDGKISREEFNNNSSLLLMDRESCQK